MIVGPIFSKGQQEDEDENEDEIDDWIQCGIEGCQKWYHIYLIQHGQTNKLSMSMIYGIVAHSNIL